MATLTTEAEFRALLERSAITEAKPLHAVLLTVWQASEAARETAKGARGLTPEGEAALAKRVSETVEMEAGRIVRRLDLRAALVLGLVGLALALGGYWTGSTYGRARAIENAAFLAQVAEHNDPAALRKYCQAHSYAQGGGTACTLPPVWVGR